MTSEEVSRRLQLFRSQEWTRDDITDWYGIDWEDADTQRVLLQARLFAGTHHHPTELGDGPYNRNHLEVFLQRRELVPINIAASEWAMSKEDFIEVITTFNDSEYATIIGPCGPSLHIVRRSFLRDFHKAFDSLRHSIFANHSSYIQRIHSVIRSRLHVSVTTIYDSTDERLDEPDRRPGYRPDCLTQPTEHIGLGREIPLETGKPIELAPDYCSCSTYFDHQSVLENSVLGIRPAIQQILDQLEGL
ncbi:hypothetical protein [Haloferula sp. A504]|uniref:hypothetical protein n=1 Tax=Haloferula sp. A504 TaxID=3373601 RepID=UPI0031C6CF82|nr:hypothetical protein [Verrucomicrobiaceae bacterium E54]